MTAHDWLDAYLLGMPGATTDYKVEWEWQRYQVGGKMFAAAMGMRLSARLEGNVLVVELGLPEGCAVPR